MALLVASSRWRKSFALETVSKFCSATPLCARAQPVTSVPANRLPASTRPPDPQPTSCRLETQPAHTKPDPWPPWWEASSSRPASPKPVGQLAPCLPCLIPGQLALDPHDPDHQHSFERTRLVIFPGGHRRRSGHHGSCHQQSQPAPASPEVGPIPVPGPSLVVRPAPAPLAAQPTPVPCAPSVVRQHQLHWWSRQLLASCSPSVVRPVTTPPVVQLTPAPRSLLVVRSVPVPPVVQPTPAPCAQPSDLSPAVSPVVISPAAQSVDLCPAIQSMDIYPIVHLPAFSPALLLEVPGLLG
ncbi:vegetative cell wall protein gp1-like [Micropterus salmoides]|uniref:vegetative cell wall protein gp1-like n=1 Tax=Micropterus salmoides TaxID=27706 RepID=UPI0018EB6BA2|nr:vegetative cell wall protein gp1-like [Micropterus salmoides]